MILLIKIMVCLSVFSSSVKVHNGFPLHFIPNATSCVFLFKCLVSLSFSPHPSYFSSADNREHF